MCELFAFSGEHPALLQYSLHAFSRHGAGMRNADGWGIAHYIDGDVRLVKEASAARDSACLNFIEAHPLRSQLVMSHIRHATQGGTAVRNCQPFVRELGGVMHVFAHNGDLERTGLGRLATSECSQPVGETDSEQAFCELLERVRPLWRGAAGAGEPSPRGGQLCAGTTGATRKAAWSRLASEHFRRPRWRNASKRSGAACRRQD